MPAPSTRRLPWPAAAAVIVAVSLLLWVVLWLAATWLLARI